MAIYTARTYQPEWHPELFHLTSLLTPLSTYSSPLLMPDQTTNLTDEQQQMLSRERELRDRLNYEHQGSQRYYHLLDTLQDVHSQMPVYGLGKYVRPYVHPEERQARQNALNLDRQLTSPRQSSLTPKEPPLLLQLSMVSQKMPIRQYTPVDEQDEKIAKGTEQRLIQQLDQMEFGTAHFYAVRDRLEGVQERLCHYTKLRGGPVSYPTYVHPAERQREQQARPRLPSLSGQHGPVMPYQRVKDIDEQRYTRGVLAPQSRTLSDIQLQPYAYNGDLAQVYQNNPGALRSALHFNYLQMAVRDVLMGMDPVVVISKIPWFNEAIRSGEISQSQLVQTVKIMAQMGGRGGNMEYLNSKGKITPARDSKMEKALRQLAGGDTPSLLASPSLQMPSREAFVAQLEAAQGKIEAWYQKTAQNAGISPGHLREIHPNLTHEQLAFIETQERQRVLNAGPGTGKTDTIFAAFLDLVFNKHVDPSTITFGSMTNSGKKALQERISKAETLLPNWKLFSEDQEQRSLAEHFQFRTFHSLAGSELTRKIEGQTVMERAGFTNFDFLGDTKDPLRGQDARQQYLENLIREKSVNQHPNMNEVLGHIASIKQNQGQAITDTTGKKTYVHDVHYQKGKKLWESGNRKDKDAWYYFYESNLKLKDGATGLPQQQETGKRYADYDDTIRMWGIAAAKKLTKRIQAGFFDEYQNASNDMLRAVRASSSPSSYLAFGGDMGQRVISGSAQRPDLFLPQVLPGIGQHVLTGNYRGSHESVNLFNSMNAHPTLQAYGTSVMQVPMSSNPGLPSTFAVDPTFEGIHAKGWQHWLEHIVRLTPEQIGQNVSEGQHPFTGAAISPSEAPFIFQMNDEIRGNSALQGFLKVVEQELSKTLGPTMASQVVREGFSTSVPTRGSQHAYTLTVPKAQARGFEQPSLFVTRGGQWDTAGYLSNLLTMESRTTQQSHYYATSANFPHSYYDNSFSPDPVTQELLPHGFDAFTRRMAAPQIVEGSLASGSNNSSAFRDFIENVIDVNRAVPLGNRIPQIGEAVGMLPGGLDKEYKEEGSSYSGMSTNELSRAALAGDWKNKPNMKVFELGEDLATSQLRNGPLEEDSSLRTSSAEAFMYDAKKLLSGVNKAKTEKVLEGGTPITLLPQYSVRQPTWNPPATRLLQPGGNAYQSLDMSIGQKTAGPVEVPLHLTDFGLSAALMQPHPVVLGHEGGKIRHIPVNPEWEQANTVTFEGHDDNEKDWGRISETPESFNANRRFAPDQTRVIPISEQDVLNILQDRSTPLRQLPIGYYPMSGWPEPTGGIHRGLRGRYHDIAMRLGSQIHPKHLLGELQRTNFYRDFPGLTANEINEIAPLAQQLTRYEGLLQRTQGGHTLQVKRRVPAEYATFTGTPHVRKQSAYSWSPLLQHNRRQYAGDEARARSGIREMLESKAGQSHPLVQQLFGEHLAQPWIARGVRRHADRLGLGVVSELDLASIPAGAIQAALEGNAKNPGLYQQFRELTQQIPGKPRESEVMQQLREKNFKATFKGLSSEQNNKIRAIASEIADKEQILQKFRGMNPALRGAGGMAAVMRDIISHRFDYDKGQAPYRVLAQSAVEQVVTQLSQAHLDPAFVERIKEIGRDLADPKSHYGLTDEQRQDFNQTVRDLENLVGAEYDQEKPMKMTEEDLADLKQKNPLKGMMLEKALRGENGELKNMQEAFADVSKYASLAGSIERTKKGQELGLPLAYSRIRPFITENENYLERLEKREGGGILHPQAYQYMQDAQGNAQYYHTGEMIALEAYERSLDQQARNPHITEGHRQALIEQLGQVSTLRLALSDPTNHRMWGHVQNILSHLTYGEGAFDPKDTGDEGRETPGFRSLFRYQRMEGREGVRSLEQVQENVAALQEMASHIQQTGMVKRAHVNRLLAAMGHMDPNAPEFRVLTQLSDRFGSANAELPLQDIARLFPQEQNNLTAQFTRFPLLPGQEVEFRGGMPGYTEIMEGDERFPGAQRGLGMKAGMRGTLLPWDEKTPFGYSKTAAGFRYNKMVSQTKDEQGVNEFMRSNRLDNEEAYGVLMRFQESGTGKVYPVRADQLGNPAYQPNRSISYYMKGNTDTTIITPQESPIVEALAGRGSGSNLTYLPGGDLFGSSMQALVNPVNTVGAMGKGLALQFKQRYPNMVPGYEQAVRSGTLQPGKLHYSQEYGPDRTIVQFPTKQDWHAPSRLEWIEQGLQEFTRTYKQQGITSAAFPMLGSGLGGLDWQTQVAPLMHKHLSGLDIPIEIYGVAPTTMTPQGPSPRVEAPAGVSSRGALTEQYRQMSPEARATMRASLFGRGRKNGGGSEPPQLPPPVAASPDPGGPQSWEPQYQMHRVIRQHLSQLGTQMKPERVGGHTFLHLNMLRKTKLPALDQLESPSNNTLGQLAEYGRWAWRLQQLVKNSQESYGAKGLGHLISPLHQPVQQMIGHLRQMGLSFEDITGQNFDKLEQERPNDIWEDEFDQDAFDKDELYVRQMNEPIIQYKGKRIHGASVVVGGRDFANASVPISPGISESRPIRGSLPITSQAFVPFLPPPRSLKVSEHNSPLTISGNSPLLLPSPRVSARRTSALSRLGNLGSGSGVIALGPHVAPPHLRLPSPRTRGLSRYQQGLARSQGSRVLPGGSGTIVLPGRMRRPLAYPARMVGAVSPLERHLFSSPSSRPSRNRGPFPPVRPESILSGLSPDERARFAKILPAWAKHYGKQQNMVYADQLPPGPDPTLVQSGAVPMTGGNAATLHMAHMLPPPSSQPSVEDQMRDLAGMIRTGSQEFGMHALSEEQRAAVEDPARFRMISGGPGGGKTNTIAGATGDWIATGGMFPKDIVSVSALHSGEEELNSRLDTSRALARRGSDPRYELPKSSTIHSLAHDILLQKEEDGSYPNLEKQGITNFSGRILYEPSPAERETMTQAQYEQVSQLHFLKQQFPGLREKDARDALEFVNNMKANRSGEGTDYNAALELGRENLGATMVVGKGRGKRRVPTYEAVLAQMQDAMSQRGDLDYNDLLYHTARHLEQNGLEGLPMHLQSTTGLVVDEGQDITQTGADMVGQFLGAIGENNPHMLIGMDPAQSLLPQTFGAVDVNKVEGLWEAMANGFGEPLSKHTLKENRRSDLGAIALNNNIRNRRELEGTARSPVQRPPKGGVGVGQYEQFHLAPTHPQLFRNMWRNMLKTAGVSYSDMATNVQAGKHPFAGIDFSSAGHVMPKDIPAILNEHKDQAIFAHEATEDIAKELGVSPEEAKKLYGQMTSQKMYKRPLISRLLRRREKPSEEEVEKMAHFPIVRHSGARSFDALYPHVDVTQSYGGDDPDQSLMGHFKKMFVALSRVRSGGRNQIFATNRPLPAYEKEAYLKNPGAFGGGMTNTKGDFLPSDGDYAFKQYGNMQVPPHFDKILRDRDKELLEGGISPTDSYFPPEVQPAIQGIAQELGVGRTQQQGPTPGPMISPSMVGMTPSSSGSSSVPMEADPAGIITMRPVGVSPDEIIRGNTPRPGSAAGQVTPPAIQSALDYLSSPLARPLRDQLQDPHVLLRVQKHLADYHDQLLNQFVLAPMGTSPADFVQGHYDQLMQGMKAAQGTPMQQLVNKGKAQILWHLANNPDQLLSHLVNNSAQLLPTTPPPPPAVSSVAGLLSSPSQSSSSSSSSSPQIKRPSPVEIGLARLDQSFNSPSIFSDTPKEDQERMRQNIRDYPTWLQNQFQIQAKGKNPEGFLDRIHSGMDSYYDSLFRKKIVPNSAAEVGAKLAVLKEMQKNPDQHLNAQNVTIKTGAHSIVTIDTGAGGGGGGTGQRTTGTGGTPGGTLPPGVTQGGPGPGPMVQGFFNANGNTLNLGATLPPPPPGGNNGTTTGGNNNNNQPISALDPRNPPIMAERTLDRIAGDITRTSQVMKQTADDAAKEGSTYRMATLGLQPRGQVIAQATNQRATNATLASAYAGQGTSGPDQYVSSKTPNTNFLDLGAQGFFNFTASGPGTIGGLQNQYLQWYSKTQIAQGIHDYIASTGAQYGQGSIGATTDIMGIAALAQMDPSQLMPMMTQVSGYTAGSPNGNNAAINQLAAYMGTTFNGNFSQQNVVPYLTAMQNLVPSLYGSGLNNASSPTGAGFTSITSPAYGTSYSQNSQLHAASLLQLAMNAGYTAQDLPDISNMLSNVTQMGMTPNVQQQYQFAHIFGQNNLTASPQYFEFQQQQLGQKQQIQQMQAGLNVNTGIAGAQKLSISQLQIEADNASIQLNQANLQMSQEQFAQNQASFNFTQWMQTQELGPIGETPQQTGRASYFNYMNRQMGAGYNPLNADSASNFQLQGQPFGLQNAEFYAGIENQRNMLTLSRSPLLADAAYQQQMKYLNEQETFYNNQLQLQNKDRAFQQTWGQRSLDAQGKVLAAQVKQNGIQIEQLNYDKAQAKIQGQYYGQFLTLLQQIQKQSLQQIQGQGPLNGQNVTPENLIQSLANDMKTKGYGYAQSEIQGLGLDAQSQGELEQMVQLLAKGGSISKIESQMSGADVKSLMDELQKYEDQGAASGAKEQAGKSDVSLNQGGTGQDWKNLTDAVTNSVNANNTLAQYLAPTSSLQKYLGELGTNTGSLTSQISSLIPLFGGLGKGLNGLDTLIGIFAGGGGGAGGAGMGGNGGTGGSMLPLPSMQVHGPFGGAIGGRGGSPGVGGEFDMGPSLPNTKDTRAWLNLFEDMVAYKQRKTNNQTVSHYGISSPNVNADFHQKMWYGLHQGVDFAAAQGTPLLSFNDGTVKNTGFFPWGGEVDVQIPGGMIERYLHLSQIGVSSGQKLKAGDRIGLTGGGTKQSGYGYWSHGPHSHVQIDTGNINAGINPWVIWEAFGDTNLRDFYVGAQAQYNAQIDSQTGSRGYQRSGGGAGLFHMANGGIAMRPLATRLGDGGEPEAVIPLSKLKSVMASVASGSPTSATTTHTSPSKTVTIQTLVGNMQVTIHTQAATMSDQEKDNLFTDLIDVLHQASQELLGTLQ